MGNVRAGWEGGATKSKQRDRVDLVTSFELYELSSAFQRQRITSYMRDQFFKVNPGHSHTRKTYKRIIISYMENPCSMTFTLIYENSYLFEIICYSLLFTFLVHKFCYVNKTIRLVKRGD